MVSVGASFRSATYGTFSMFQKSVIVPTLLFLSCVSSVGFAPFFSLLCRNRISRDLLGLPVGPFASDGLVMVVGLSGVAIECPVDRRFSENETGFFSVGGVRGFDSAMRVVRSDPGLGERNETGGAHVLEIFDDSDKFNNVHGSASINLSMKYESYKAKQKSCGEDRVRLRSSSKPWC